TGTKNLTSIVRFQHHQNDGYRKHSELRRDVLSWNGRFLFDTTRQLQASFLYGDLEYETPGALTLTEYKANPQQARPGNAAFPGAEQAKASVNQRTFLAGITYTQMLLPAFQNKTTLYGAYTQLRNPAIQNYGRNSEPHVGGRSVFKWVSPLRNGEISIDAGLEWQQGFASYSIHDNEQGRPDTLRAYNEVNNRQSFVFTQASIEVNKWVFTAGLSSNQRNITFRVFEPTILPEETKKFNNELAPRVALLRKWNHFSVYTSVSKGFSPPTTEEIFPTGGEMNLQLDAENGTNYDLGVRGQFGNLSFDVNTFIFSLNSTIVQRRTAGGGSYFINAGKTDQRGLEAQANYSLFQHSPIFDKSLLWISYAWYDFRYKSFKQVDSDYSNNDLPGVAPHNIASGLDLQAQNGLLGSLTYYYNAKAPLNDANTANAEAFHLIGARAGYQKVFMQKWRLKLIVGIENLLDERYSLGNDINGFGGRYYNAAPGRNYFTSLIFQWLR
ncbi:MAG TPA: TonB-dependent receptor, partial [Flavisolibacter sp.]|nr:TonB-dependent receptor [Flavisolibacter sp.]